MHDWSTRCVNKSMLSCHAPPPSPAEFLESTAQYITDAPFPRPWMQGSAAEPAQVAQLPVPTEHAAWFDQGTTVVHRTCTTSRHDA